MHDDFFEAPANSLKDSNVNLNLKVEITIKKVGVHSLLVTFRR
jgi:hypothetical protein